jgi:hypothetical protein
MSISVLTFWYTFYKSSYQVKTSCMSFKNVLYDWFIDWLLVAECPLCKCKSLGPLSFILGNPKGNLKKNIKSRSFSCTYKKRGRRSELKI